MLSLLSAPMKTRYLLLIFSILYFFMQSSCKKDELLTDSSAKLSFSEDTLLYDTVFVTIGSVTKNLRIYNTYDQPLKVSNIHLAGGPSSNFRMNVNGLPGYDFKDIEIRPGDSLWIFVEVTIDQNNQNLPFIIKDSITFETNGNLQDVKLVAWGQNAHFFVAKKVSQNLPPYVLIDTIDCSTTTWNDTLPYVIYGGYAVVDSCQTLIIKEGTQIHFSTTAGFWVYKGGTLKVQGTKDKPVVFQGLRREPSLSEEPGQWDRIWINDGGVNEIDYAIIKNSFIGIQAETISLPQMAESLKITNTFIRNISGYGILSFNFNIEGWNDVVANCGKYAAFFAQGGDYKFTHCTFANYWRNGQRNDPSVYMNNYYVDNNGTAQAVAGTSMSRADFFNCIIYGNNDNELEFDFIAGADSVHQFKNVLVRADNDHPTSDPLNFTNIYRNSNPGFIDPSKNDYQLDTLSFCINKGDNALNGTITLDLKGNPRNQGLAPDLGAFERE